MFSVVLLASCRFFKYYLFKIIFWPFCSFFKELCFYNFKFYTKNLHHYLLILLYFELFITKYNKSTIFLKCPSKKSIEKEPCFALRRLLRHRLSLRWNRKRQRDFHFAKSGLNRCQRRRAAGRSNGSHLCALPRPRAYHQTNQALSRELQPPSALRCRYGHRDFSLR